ncbi:MAG: UvrD-helicase domain-containing protein, partial [Clostridia bacterium]|nr:UvrD-helicase domain-containing protein [Clostridia bacterium]
MIVVVYKRQVSAYDAGTDDADAQPWARELRAEAVAALDRALGRLARARDLAHSGGLEAHAACLAEDLERLAALRRAAEGPWEAFRRQAAAWAWERLPSARVASAGQRAVRDAVRQWRDRAKKEVEDLVQRVAARPMAEWLSELRQLAGPARTLVDLAVEFGQAYTSAKRAQARLDFADLERLAFRLLQDEGAPAGRLVPSPVACELRERFAAVLVDEYQDINPLQDAILRLLARPGAFFAVGDVKQSIYGFRLADPGLFAARSAAARRLPLRENFRSRPPLVTFVNETFARLMVPELAGTAYDEEARMVPAAEYPPPPPGVPVAGDGGIGPPACSLLLVDADGDGEGQGAGDALELEAAAVARQVRELVLGTPERPGPQQWVWDRQEGRYRPLTWRDVAVLLRTVRGRAEVFVEAFAREGVPACAEVSSGYFEAEEVRTVLSLLAVIDNPRQDIPLVGVLRSPVVDLTAEDLARVRLCLREGDFYDAVRAAARGAGPVPAELAERLDRFLSDLERWRTEARRGPLSRLLWRIYRETGYLYYVEGLPGGAARRANLLALLDRARQFDGFARQGLFRFLRFVERLREGGEPVGRPPAVGEGEDVVRVMSVHRSKGLEFPVVVVAGLGARFNLRDVGEDVLVDRELGLGLRVVDLEGRVKYPSAVHAAVARRRRRLLLGEELRLLYVAMTRARERLLLVGCVSERQRSAGAWALAAAAAGRSGPLSLADLLEAQCWLDWLVPVLLVRPDGADLRAAVGAWSEEARDTLGTGPQRLAVGGTGDTTTADAVAAGAAIFA